MCDGIPHCRDGSDEKLSCGMTAKTSDIQYSLLRPSRPQKCSEDQFQCGMNGKCIPLDWTCDGFEDCGPDGLDENFDCPTVNSSTYRCLIPGYYFLVFLPFFYNHFLLCFFFRDFRGREVIPMSDVCNGQHDCSNGVDEGLCVWTTEKLPIALDEAG